MQYKTVSLHLNFICDIERLSHCADQIRGSAGLSNEIE